MKLSLQTERSSSSASSSSSGAAVVDDDDGTTDEVTCREDREKLPEAFLTKRQWTTSELETWRKQVENLASLTFDIEASLRRSHSTATRLAREVEPVADRAYDAERSLRECNSYVLGIDDRLRSLSGSGQG